MKTVAQYLRTAKKRSTFAPFYSLHGYVYNSGIDLVERREDQDGIRYEANFYANYPIKMPKELIRLVFHNGSLFAIGQIEQVSYYSNNRFDDSSTTKLGIDIRAVEIHYVNGVRLTFEEDRMPRSSYFTGTDISIQVVGDYGIPSWTTDNIENDFRKHLNSTELQP